MTKTKRQKRLAKLRKQNNLRKNNYSYRTQYQFVETIAEKPTSLPQGETLVVANKENK